MPKSLKEIIVNQATKDPIEVRNKFALLRIFRDNKFSMFLIETAEHNMGILRGRESSRRREHWPN